MKGEAMAETKHGDPFVVDALAHHMVDLSRHLTVTQLWMETES